MPAPQAAPPPPALGGGEFSLGEMPEAPPASMPSPFATLGPAVPAVPAPAPAAPFDTAPDAPSGAVDPRISQFLKQGDEALAKGQIQEAIDLWSRVFLIDLSNEEASQRIDAAREKQAETARRIDMLLSEGIHQYDAGDLAGARHKFLDVLALSESDSTARSYLNQIDAAIAEKSGPIAPAASSLAQPSFSQMGLGETPSSYGSDMDLGEPTATPSYESTPALEEGELEHVPSAAARKVRVDARVFLAAGLLVVVAVGAGVYFLLKKKEPVPAATQPPAAQRKQPGGPAAGDDAIARANVLLAQGKLEEARAIVTSIPDTDPRYPAALDVMERIKSAVVPTPGPATAVSAASLDEMRIAGIAASRGSRYIDAVKSLDPVVKARPEDVEAAEVLTKAREQVAAMGTAVKAYNEQDYQTAIRLFWDLHRKDTKNQDVEDFLFRSYFNDAIQDLQAGNSTKSADSFKEASSLRPGDAEAKRHLAFVRKYSKGATDLLARIYIKHLTPRP
jgi:tetratricopeptide (TPR) repeat protein